MDFWTISQITEFSWIALAVYGVLTFANRSYAAKLDAEERVRQTNEERDQWRKLACRLAEDNDNMTQRYKPELTSGSLITHTISIRCAYCDALYLDPRGSEIVENTADSFQAMPRTLVCKSCCHRFVKPIPLGWSRHPLAHALRTPARQRPTPGDGQTRPSIAQNASQSTLTARTAIRRIDLASERIRTAEAAVRDV